MQPSQQQTNVQAIITKCWEDETFKQELIASPQATIEQFIGQSISIPEGMKLVVNDQSNRSIINFNIPAEPSLEDVKLTDDQLEVVAGGGIPFFRIDLPKDMFPIADS